MAKSPRALLYMMLFYRMLWPHFSLVIPPGSATSGTLMGQLYLSVLRGKRPYREGADAARLDELGCQESLDEIPGYGRSYLPAAHTNNVHGVVLDTLPGRDAVGRGSDRRGRPELLLAQGDARTPLPVIATPRCAFAPATARASGMTKSG
jgi:hypothetical protein